MINIKLNKIFTILLIVFSFLMANSQTNAQVEQTEKSSASKKQTSSCSIGTINFTCPDGFTKEETTVKNTLLFRKEYMDLVTYLFVSVPSGNFEEAKIKETIAGKFSPNTAKKFVWKEVKNPLLMNLESSYKKSAKNLLGFDGKRLFNYLDRSFSFKNKNIFVGYVYEMKDVDVENHFKKGLGGENAVGCNAVASIINSVTKEKEGEKQYCSLSITIGTAKKIND
ncbi:MAG TPA: hypothetical protein VK892_19085 [Pyrinomonadaceae bacterium]|nr:hypothetical protein [Pyrinomonadaceae bacterium]